MTPPVAVAAYAAASMAGADPFKTGNTAFRLALAKALVPFMFVFAPSMLIMVPEFTWQEFALSFLGALTSITFLGAALSAYMLAPLPLWQRIWLVVAAIPAMATGLAPLLVALAIGLPVVILQFIAMRRKPDAPQG